MKSKVFQILVPSSLQYTLSTTGVRVPNLDISEHVSCVDCHTNVLYSIGEILSYFMTQEQKFINVVLLNLILLTSFPL